MFYGVELLCRAAEVWREERGSVCSSWWVEACRVRVPQAVPSHSRLPLQVDQAGLGLPSRDYYLNKTENEKVSGPLQREWLRPQLSPEWFVPHPCPPSVQVFEAGGTGTLRCHLPDR